MLPLAPIANVELFTGSITDGYVRLIKMFQDTFHLLRQVRHMLVSLLPPRVSLKFDHKGNVS